MDDNNKQVKQYKAQCLVNLAHQEAGLWSPFYWPLPKNFFAKSIIMGI